MSTFIERLKAEKVELDEKIEKLDAFTKSGKFNEIDPVQMTLLNIQLQAMKTYSEILHERIVRL